MSIYDQKKDEFYDPNQDPERRESNKYTTHRRNEIAEKEAQRAQENRNE